MHTNTTHYRVRYADTDKMGYLYYGHYAKLYEIGRVEMLRDLEMPYKFLEDDLKIMLPVLSVESRYYQPAYYDDLLTIVSQIDALPSKMITVHTQVYNEAEILLHKASVKLFFIDMDTSKRISAPAFFVDKLRPFFDQ